MCSCSRVAESSLDEPRPDLRGGSLSLVGRTLHVARGTGGIGTFRDESTESTLHFVNALGNNVFSPKNVNIASGDSVRWSNLGGFHNVFSCVPGQTGCCGESPDVFSNAPSGLPWFFTVNFPDPGSKPYVCQPHVPEMTGMVTVDAPSAWPPPVPDGTGGTPMTVVGLDVPAETLLVSWDEPACAGAANYQILYGGGSQLPAGVTGRFALLGSECTLGSSPYTWYNTPDPAQDPSGFIWWLVVATDGLALEGSWGQARTITDQVERSWPLAGGGSGECGLTGKNFCNTCGP